MHHEYELPDPNLFEMTGVPPNTSRTYSDLAADHKTYSQTSHMHIDTYSGLAAGHKTYSQTSHMLLPGQLAAPEGAAAAAYEEPVPARRWTQKRLPSNLNLSRGPQSHIYHLAGGSGDYIDVTSDEQTA